MRRLLPYEHQLVEHLGISEADYLEFLALQHDYTRSPEEKLQELRGEPVSTIALVLTIVGTLFQVAAALLAPKPEQDRQARNRRDQVFAPRFGFNSTQELAKYGDVVNLVYTNTRDNPEGGVRVATSLVWSALSSFGNSQYMQLLMVVGAGRLGNIDASKTAFGQTPVNQFVTKKTWTYFNPEGPATFNDLTNTDQDITDPARKTLAPSELINHINDPTTPEKQEGFSQSFSPSTLNRCGIYAPIPINVQAEIRDKDGKIRTRNIRVVIPSGLVGSTPDYWPNLDAAKNRPLIPVGHQFVLRFRQIDTSDSEAQEYADDTRRTLVSNIDGASIYKLGSAKFRVLGEIDGDNIDGENVNVTFECIESGICPQEDYGTERYDENRSEAVGFIADLQASNAVLNGLLAENGGVGAPIFKPEIRSTTDALEQEVNGLNDFIEDLRSFRSNDPEREKLRLRDLEVTAVTDPIVGAIIVEIDQLEDKLEDLREIDNPTDAQKKKKRETKKAIKQAERRLKKSIIDYGSIFSVDDSNRNIRQTIKDNKRLLVSKQRSLAQFQNNSAYWDYAAMEVRNQGWRDQVAANNRAIADYQEDIDNPNELNDYFNTKCIVKVEEASYSTITQCKVVDFALKARVFKRVQGRAKKYAEVEEDKYKDSDNGVKFRSFFFWLLYRKVGGTEFERVPRIFVIRRSADIDNYISLKFVGPDNSGGWEFKFDPIAETAAEMRTHGELDFAYLENRGNTEVIPLPDGSSIHFFGRLRNRKDIYQAPRNNNPIYLDEWGLFSLRTDSQCQFSFDNGPEMTIVAVTEQSRESFPDGLYKNLAMFGFNTYSGQGIQDLRSVSVFVTEGKWVRVLDETNGNYPNEATGPSCFTPDIFLDTILDTTDGIGQYAKIAGIDLQGLALAKRFCKANQFFFDGVIAQQTPWRQFWAEVAPYSLLELARVGGKETLIPAVPCNNAGVMDRRVTVTGMFTAGNILEDSYKEEFLDYGSSVQDLIATVIYRETKANEAFPRNRSVEIRLADVSETVAIRQTFDLSQFVTSRTQAITYAKLLCNQRRYIRRAIEFRTFPTSTPLSPGAYIYVDIGQSQWDNIRSGMIEAGGALNTPVAGTVPDGTYSVLLWRQGEREVVTQASVSISGNTASGLAQYSGWLFVLGTKATNKRVMRVTEVQMDEEGEVTVRCVEHPCVISGNLTLSRIAQFSDTAVTSNGENHPGFQIT